MQDKNTARTRSRGFTGTILLVIAYCCVLDCSEWPVPLGAELFLPLVGIKILFSEHARLADGGLTIQFLVPLLGWFGIGWGGLSYLVRGQAIFLTVQLLGMGCLVASTVIVCLKTDDFWFTSLSVIPFAVLASGKTVLAIRELRQCRRSDWTLRLEDVLFFLLTSFIVSVPTILIWTAVIFARHSRGE